MEALKMLRNLSSIPAKGAKISAHFLLKNKTRRAALVNKAAYRKKTKALKKHAALILIQYVRIVILS